ncbi:hypothetical protein ACFPES_32225 [Paenibacillus sp. GCM10023248]|nr:hypothetical protein [Paenibacillus sp. MAHUQ-63]MDD9271710.1 hypothetical protein [Paenibacillus sp. MAHUQ-63]
MRNILITVMMLIVVAFLFTTIVNDGSTGLRRNISTHGSKANTEISALRP